MISAIRLVNLFWSIVNLLPVLPLDGGQLLRIAMEGLFGVKGFKASLLIGTSFAVLLSFYFFLVQAFLLGAFFFLFAFQSFDMWRKSRAANPLDREDDLKKMLVHGEMLLQSGRKGEAERQFEDVRQKGGGGLLSAAASQYLAFLYAEEQKRREAYDLLIGCETLLEDPARCLLHQLAAEQGDHQRVAKLSAECYQYAPKQETALRNAIAFAALRMAEPSGGWLQTAWQHGAFDLNALLNEDVFASVRDQPAFRRFVDTLNEKK
jgi:stage IV sporulation protein FB